MIIDKQQMQQSLVIMTRLFFCRQARSSSGIVQMELSQNGLWNNCVRMGALCFPQRVSWPKTNQTTFPCGRNAGKKKQKKNAFADTPFLCLLYVNKYPCECLWHKQQVLLHRVIFSTSVTICSSVIVEEEVESEEEEEEEEDCGSHGDWA